MKKIIKPAKLNYPQRVIATPHGLSANETERAHKITYFTIDTLAEYQETTLAREYRKFWYELTPKEAVKRIDEELDKFGMNVFTSPVNKEVIFNIHLAIYTYQGKKFLCPRMIIRDLKGRKGSSIDGAGVLIAPHCLARMLSRSQLQFKQATHLLGGVVLQMYWAMGTKKIPSFYQNLHLVAEVGIKGVGVLKGDPLVLEEDVYCDGKMVIPAGKRVLLLKTWIDESTLREDYFTDGRGQAFHYGELVQ